MRNKLGEHLKMLRETRGLLQREVAANLGMDGALLSKMERGDRIPRKEILIKWGNILNADTTELVTIWLAERVYKMLDEEDLALKALRLAEDEVKYRTKSRRKRV